MGTPPETTDAPAPATDRPAPADRVRPAGSEPGSVARSSSPALGSPRGELAQAIPRRPRVTWWLGLVFALAFALVAMPAITADRWLAAFGAGQVVEDQAATLTIRVPALAGHDAAGRHFASGGIVIARGQVATAADVENWRSLVGSTPHGALPYLAFLLLTFVLGALFTHHMQRSTRGRLVRVQIVSLLSIALLAVAVKVLVLTTAISVLVIPVAMLAIIPTLALDRIVGLATGILGALVVALLGPFDVGVAIVLLVQAAAAGLLVAEQPKDRWRSVLAAGAATTVCTTGTFLLLTYLTTGQLPVLRDPLHSSWFAAAIGPALATAISLPLVPLYQLLVGEITRGKLIELEDLGQPLLRQIAERAPGTWQHSLMMANMAEIAANAIGASGRLVRVGAYYHDLGKSLQPKYFIENLDPGETSPHDQLSPEVSCDAIFAHVTEGIVTARRARLHERIIDFMHMHHGNGVLEYFWGKTKEQGNPRGFSIEQFRYPGHPPQSRETAILAICDAVEAASRTLKKPDEASIGSLVQRIVYGKLHLGQLDESGLSMSDLRRVSDSLRETIRHANHGRIEYPWQKAQQDASATTVVAAGGTQPRLDSLDHAPARREIAIKPAPVLATETTGEVALAATSDLRAKQEDPATIATAPALVREVQPARQTGSHRISDLTKRRSTPPPVGSEPAQTRAPTQPPPASVAPEVVAPARVAPDGAPPASVPLASVTPDSVSRAAVADGPSSARKRAATLPPTLPRRSPTLPPPSASANRSPTLPPAPYAGPPPLADLDSAVTHPPPVRNHVPSSSPVKPSLLILDEPEGVEPPLPPDPHGDVTSTGIAVAPPAGSPFDEAAESPFPRIDDAVRTLEFERPTFESSATQPSMPRFTLPLPPPAVSPAPNQRDANTLARRVDAALERDEWSPETPIRAPSPAELRSLLGQPDPTRQQSLEELERLHRAALTSETPDPELFTRRAPMPTTEVDPDDIESAIELAPPARRAPTAIAVSKASKKSE